MTGPDRERAQVVAAELAAFDGTDLEAVIGFDAIVEVIEKVTSTLWWERPPVAIRSARRDARSSSTRCSVADGIATEIRIAAPQATRATAAHELAHVLAGVRSGHGDVYRRAHLDVVQVMTNIDPLDARGRLHIRQLGDAYDAAGLVVGTRTWPEPPEPRSAIAL